MKVIDLLNKTANDELKDGFKFKFDYSNIFKYNKKSKIFCNDIDGELSDYCHITDCLNCKIEIIEEPKKMTVSEVCKELGYDIEIVKE